MQNYFVETLRIYRVRAMRSSYTRSGHFDWEDLFGEFCLAAWDAISRGNVPHQSEQDYMRYMDGIFHNVTMRLYRDHLERTEAENFYKGEQNA